MRFIGSCVWTHGPQVVDPTWKALESSGGGGSLKEGRNWATLRFASWPHFLFTVLPVLPRLRQGVPTAHSLLHGGAAPFLLQWTISPPISRQNKHFLLSVATRWVFGHIQQDKYMLWDAILLFSGFQTLFSPCPFTFNLFMSLYLKRILDQGSVAQ